MKEIEILFKEYDTLRQEVISRTSNGYQMAAMFSALGAALLSWVIVGKPPLWLWVVVVFMVSMTAITTGTGLYGEIRWIDARLRELEDQINGLAGKKLLCWTNRWVKGNRNLGSSLRKIKS